MAKFHRICPKFYKFLIVPGLIFMLSGCVSNSNLENQNQTEGHDPTHIPTRETSATPTLPPHPSPDMNGEVFTLQVLLLNQLPFREINLVAQKGMEDYAAYQNSHGGVNGAVLQLQFIEVSETGEVLQEAVQKAAEEEGSLAVLILAPIDDTLYELINELKLPAIYFGLGGFSVPLDAEDDHLFWVVPTPNQQLEAWLDYAITNWKTLRPEGQFDVMRLSYFGWEQAEPDPDQSGGWQSLIEEKSIVFVSEGRLARTVNPSAANPILDAVFNQATMIYMDLYSYGPASVINDLGYLNLTSMFNLGGGSWSLGINFEKYLPEFLVGSAIYTTLPIAWWSQSDNPGIQQAEKIFSAGNRKADEKELAYLYALAGMDIATEAIREALVEQKKSTEIQLSKEDIYLALNQMKNYLVLGGLYQLDFSDGLRVPTEIRIWKYAPGEGLVVVSETMSFVENN